MTPQAKWDLSIFKQSIAGLIQSFLSARPADIPIQQVQLFYLRLKMDSYLSQVMLYASPTILPTTE